MIFFIINAKILLNVFRHKQALKLVTLLKHVILTKNVIHFCKFKFYKINDYLRKKKILNLFLIFLEIFLFI